MSITSWAARMITCVPRPEKSGGKEDKISKEGGEDTGEWKNCQKSKFEAKTNAEVQAEKAWAKNSFTKRLPTLRHKVEGRQARAEVRRNQQAVRLTRQVERIQNTRRLPSRLARQLLQL